jgi:hypothetical protein
MPRDWRDGGEDRETLVARDDLSHRDQEEEEGEGSLQQQSRPAHQDSVYKYGNNSIVNGSVGDPDPHLFEPPGSMRQRYGSGSFPFSHKGVERTEIMLQNKILTQKF